MMPEISLNILDVAQNSIRADARNITISIHADTLGDTLITTIKDDGCGMDDSQLQNVTDPFFTTRTTRKIGLGIPFYKLAAEHADGSFSINSKKGFGTTVTAVFRLSSFNRMPLGDINATIHTLITMNPNINFLFNYQVDERLFSLDTKEFKQILGGIPLNTPDVSNYIKDYLSENKQEVDNGIII